MTCSVETERETDGRWIAEIPDLPGVIAYGDTRAEAKARVQALALRVVADRLEHGELSPEFAGIKFCRGVSGWPSIRASRVLAALLRVGSFVKHQTGSHRVLSRVEWPDVVFAFHDREEIDPRILARIAKRTR